MNTAIVFITTAVDQVSEVAEEVAALDSVTEVYSVTGGIDLIVMVRVPAFEAVAEVVTDKISKVPGVIETTTHLAFRAFSQHDLEATFALGNG